MLAKSEARSLAGEIVAGEQPELWEALCEVYDISEDTCTISQLIEILENEDPKHLNPLIH